MFMQVGVSSFSGDAGPSDEMDKLKASLQPNDVQQDKSRNPIGDLGVDQIENMLKGKQFSRDESKRLMEILKSRLIDVSDAEGEKKTATVTFQEHDKVDVLDREVRSTLTPVKQYDVDRAVLETPAPRLQSNMQDEVAASPIDIAKAYMGRRTSEVGININTGGKEQFRNDVFPSESNIITPYSKSSTCWPGAMVQDRRGYMTPQSQRGGGGYGLHNFRQTPYSRTIYSSSKAKLNRLQGNNRSSNISLTPFQQSRTPNPWQMKTTSDVMDVGYGSVGPIRRVRNKFASEPQSEGPKRLSSSSSSASRSFVPIFQKNPVTSGTRGISDLRTADRQEHTFKDANPAGPSDDAVRKILERLDRHKPTPKEKAAELKLATEWKSSPSKDTNMMPKRTTVLQDLTGPSSVKEADGGTSFKAPVTTSNAGTKTSSVVDDAGAGSVSGFKNTGVAYEKPTVTNNTEQDKSQKRSFDNQINGQDLTKKRSSQPVLKPISFKRPDPQQVISSDNGRGFTFPWSANANSASEPPTPSVMPFFPATSVPQSKELASIPTYSFGATNSSERVVFSFASTNSGPINDSESDIKFDFGSGKKRVSFASIGSDAIVTK